jgi:hypothetical protein
MASTMEQGLEEVRALVTRFNHDAESYRKSSYLEANLRDEFLGPLFEALGWDMKNTLGRAVSRREVVVELNTNAGRPDYTFLHGNEPVLIVEAKRPYENITTNRHHAIQARQYGHEAGVPVAILTNFDEFACYRCDIKPRAGDGPEVARIGPVLKYSEYLAEWKKLYETFGKNAVYGDSLVRFARPNIQRTMIAADFSGGAFPVVSPPDQAPAQQPSAVQTIPGVATLQATPVFNDYPTEAVSSFVWGHGRLARRTPAATIAMQKKVGIFVFGLLVMAGIAWKACSGPTMPPLAELVNCTVAARVGFHLRPRPMVDSVGPIFPVNTLMLLVAPISGVTRNDEVLFQVQVLTTGRVGYAFVGPSEASARFNCPSR